MKIRPIIIAGGSGTRLWPLSRTSFPKQFSNFFSERSLLQNTVLRVNSDFYEDPIIVCNEDHRFLVKKQIDDLGINTKIVLEPEQKNTSAAIGLAANFVEEDSVMLVMSADGSIPDEDLFNNSVQDALRIVDKNLIVFGLKPKSPHTGFGYIKAGEKIEGGYAVDSFVEKPTKNKAEKYIELGNYFWNMGIFMFNASTFLNELEKYESELHNLIKKSVESSSIDGNFYRVDKNYFSKCKNISIDYAVMERTKIAKMIQLDIHWNDLGSWDQIYEFDTNKDEQGNSLKGNIEVFNTKNTLIHGSNRFILSIGLDDIIISDTKDALLVAKKDKIDQFKDAVNVLKEKKYEELDRHTKVYRPWGSYECIDSGPNFNVKRLIINPLARLSVQKHFKRSEHWIVVEGEAEVRNGDNLFVLKQNESTYVAKGTVHSLKNNSKDKDLHIIEIQTGTYFGEDDIVRLEDIYGRTKDEK